MDFANVIAGLFVGFLVGMTGVGGGSLMAPILVLLFGVAPASAVGTDLWFAAITKMFGGAIHFRRGGVDHVVLVRLMVGSLPAAIVTLLILSRLENSQIKDGLIINVLGIVLILTAAATLFRHQVLAIGYGVVAQSERVKATQAPLTIVAGAILGVLVTLTSIGAGALGLTMLICLYPKRMSARRLVATDIVHAIPLTVAAGTGYLLLGNVDVMLLGNLLIGSIPGIIAGSILSTRVLESSLRGVLALVLLAVGIRMLVV